ncbi:carcinine hydrolase/isopenicillin-N N-acyltransferase family protein [Pseudochryseolinea flava]|uniref:Penicillin acylase n=1 Tax=Pseudochryseolinea flava TaxID=2059302 RepID=A0A364XZE2_9BACT|nr:carcinine hydrolase/isopenicillin-N N-acyltransferase family protein [Pseudochryseolinea flava]RAV98966.1 penicillin acylase [Pseudochryseolinea flava]
MNRVFFVFVICCLLTADLKACSVVYYRDAVGKIYVANNEDYWYDTNAKLYVIPGTNKKNARLWYGWDGFAQGGVNAQGLFFDGAVTPDGGIPSGYGAPKGNLGDDILATCASVDEAVTFLETKKIALRNGHMMFGDRHGNAVVVEWVDSRRVLNYIAGNKLIMTNFLLADPTRGNYPCMRYYAIHEKLSMLDKDTTAIGLGRFGNAISPAVQQPQTDASGRVGGTLYSTFINITDMEFVIVYKLEGKQVLKLNLNEQFRQRKRFTLSLKNLELNR